MIMPKMNGYVKTFKVEEGDIDKGNKLMSYCIDDEKLFEKYETIWTEIELNVLPVFFDIYKKRK